MDQQKPSGRRWALLTAVLGTAWFLLWVAVDWWQSQPEPRLTGDATPLFAWYLLAIVVLAALLRRRSAPEPSFAAVLALTMGLVPLPLVLAGVVAAYVSPLWFWVLNALAAVCAFLYLAFGLRRLTGRPQPSAALAGILFIAVFIAISNSLDVIPDVWAPRDAESDAADSGPVSPVEADAEGLLFDQSHRIDAALESIHRGQGAGPQAFFLGFAGVGDEKVFAQEIGLAARVLGERYAMDGRELSLINDQRDLDRAPIASVAGLRYTLRGLAARMDPQRDVLFLSISSHGSDDPAIIVSNSELPLNNLTDAALVEALQDSGIKWRVIILSACYAGGFVESLKNPQTIVITAAAADRTSFGCGSASDLTYFGEAFYRDALPAARSLRAAFVKAAAAIAERERKEHVAASQPQGYFGKDLESKLATMPAH